MVTFPDLFACPSKWNVLLNLASLAMWWNQGGGGIECFCTTLPGRPKSDSICQTVAKWCALKIEQSEERLTCFSRIDKWIFFPGLIGTKCVLVSSYEVLHFSWASLITASKSSESKIIKIQLNQACDIFLVLCIIFQSRNL